MGCGASKPTLHHGAPTTVGTQQSGGSTVAQTNKEFMKMQATGGGSVLLSTRAPLSEQVSAAAVSVHHDPGETTITKGGSYIVGRLLKDFTLGNGQAPPEIEPLPSTRQTYIPQPDGAVLRVSYG